MLLSARSSLLTAACALAAILPAHHAQATDVFNWGNYTYAPTPAQSIVKTDVGAVNGTTVSVQFGNNSYFANNTDPATTNVTNPASPAIGTYNATANATNRVSPLYADGGSGASTGTSANALQILADFDNSAGYIIANSSIPVTVFFSKPVSGLIFSFYDSDNGTVNGGGYTDLVTGILATAAAGGNVIPASLAATNSSLNTTSIDPVTGGRISAVAGSASNPQSAAGGNVAVTFGNTPISSFTFNYTDTASANAAANTVHSTLQIVALSNLQLNVPEPSTWAMLGVGGVAGACALRRRARRTA